MIKKGLFATAALAALAGTAFAADLPSRRAPPVYAPPPLPVFTWTGFYLGVNAGYAFDGDHRDRITANDPFAQTGLDGAFVPGFIRNRSSGFTGGGQIGYNYQFGGSSFGPGGIVVGLEADAAYTDLRRTTDVIGAGLIDTNFHSHTDYVGTIRGRLGYAFDRFLVYGTGGFAYGGLHTSTSIILPGGALYYGGAQNSSRAGYAYGGGVEYAIPTDSFLNFFHTSAVTVKAEFLHYDLGTSSYIVPAVTAPAGSAFTSHVHTEGNLVRAGLNYKFGSIVAPVVARY